MVLEIALTLLVILIALALFVTEVVTVDLAALIVMSLLLVLGLVTPEQGISGFSNPATITVLAMFILSAGIERTGAVGLLAQKVASVAGNREWAQVAVIVLIVAPVSAFLNNTAAVAIMIPLVVGLARRSKRSPSKLLLPLSYASMLGGVVTLIGTSTNILASSMATSLGHGPFTMFQFTGPGLVVAGVGVLYLLTVGRLLAPDRGVAHEQHYNVARYLGELTVTPTSRVAGKRIGDLGLTDRYGVEVVQVARGLQAVRSTTATVLQPGDVLLVLGEREKLLELAALEGLKLEGADTEPAAARGGAVGFYEAIVSPRSWLIGRTLTGVRFRTRYGGTVVAMRKGARVLHTHTPISRAYLDAGDALLIAGTPEDRNRWADSTDLILVEDVGDPRYRRERVWVALAIMAGVVGLAALGVFPILVTAVAGAVLMALTGVLNMEEFHRAIRWDILFLLAGLIPLGIAMQNSGLADVMGGLILASGGALSPFLVLVVVYAITSLLTQIISNNAAVVLVAPVAVTVAESLGLNPLTFLFAVAFAASTAFLTPMGYQTNAMVYGPGGYRFTDYARVGLPLNLLLIVLTPWVLTAFFPL